MQRVHSSHGRAAPSLLHDRQHELVRGHGLEAVVLPRHGAGNMASTSCAMTPTSALSGLFQRS